MLAQAFVVEEKEASNWKLQWVIWSLLNHEPHPTFVWLLPWCETNWKNNLDESHAPCCPLLCPSCTTERCCFWKHSENQVSVLHQLCDLRQVLLWFFHTTFLWLNSSGQELTFPHCRDRQIWLPIRCLILQIQQQSWNKQKTKQMCELRTETKENHQMMRMQMLTVSSTNVHHGAWHCACKSHQSGTTVIVAPNCVKVFGEFFRHESINFEQRT